MTTKPDRPATPPGVPPTELIELSRFLGSPEYAVLADGNTSARATDAVARETFWVKASGTSLAQATETDFVLIDLARARAMLARADMTDAQVRAELIVCKIDARPTPLPSIETVMHAALLSYAGVRFVGHTHPTSINALTCSTRFRDALSGRIFPEEVVVCGPESVLVPYADPGLPLARLIKTCVDDFVQRRNELPRAIYLQNHGFIAIGASAREIRNITIMSDKAAKIRAGALAAGGLTFLSDADINRIHGRSDIHYRQKIMAGDETKTPAPKT
jgi:rhamnose utilization protein RhaD (predicted bifunctional aldolase and dehydrogenase)